MSVFFNILAIVTLIVVIAFGLTKLGTMIFNIMAIHKAKQSPDLRNQRQGIVLDRTNNRLEADQSFITPF